jgi:hypothetical protein
LHELAHSVRELEEQMARVLELLAVTTARIYEREPIDGYPGCRLAITDRPSRTWRSEGRRSAVRTYDDNWPKHSVADKLKTAARSGVFRGILDGAAVAYLDDCKAFHSPTGTLLIFTRDTAEYDRCLHLSISFREPFAIGVRRPFDEQLAEEWCALFFGEAKPIEDSPVSPEVRHYRVFCDANWQPIQLSPEQIREIKEKLELRRMQRDATIDTLIAYQRGELNAETAIMAVALIWHKEVNERLEALPDKGGPLFFKVDPKKEEVQ